MNDRGKMKGRTCRGELYGNGRRGLRSQTRLPRVCRLTSTARAPGIGRAQAWVPARSRLAPRPWIQIIGSTKNTWLELAGPILSAGIGTFYL